MDDLPGQSDWVRERFHPAVLCPAAGQGALAVETLANAADVIAAVAVLDDPATRFAVEAERWLLHGLGGGCSLPVGALCTAAADRYVLQANVTAPDGERMLTLTEEAAVAESAAVFGKRVADHLLSLGALALLNGEDVLDGEFADSTVR